MKNPKRISTYRPSLQSYSRFILWYGIYRQIEWRYFDLKFLPQIDLLVGRISWKFQLKRMFPSWDIKFPKIIHVPRKMREAHFFGNSIFCERNILLSWNFQVEIPSFDLSVYTIPYDKTAITLDGGPIDTNPFGVFHNSLGSTLCIEFEL
jgi:hypothetical protein